MKPSLLSAILLLGGASLYGAPVARAQLSPDLIMETYNSNVSVITTGIINNQKRGDPEREAEGDQTG